MVISPFTLAWPAAMYRIAKQSDAVQTFSFVFRWFGFLLLFAAYSLSLIGIIVLYVLFPPAYHSSALIIPIVSESLVFGGIYYVLMVGANLARKTWLATIFTAIAASINFILNLLLIPKYGATGAAISTLIAYLALAMLAYMVNQRIYPVSFEVGRFSRAFFVGVITFFGSAALTYSMQLTWQWAVCLGIVTTIAYGLWLCFLGRLGTLVGYRSASKILISRLIKHSNRI